jgi:hypothetical protein
MSIKLPDHACPAADPVRRLFKLQIRHMHFAAQIPHLEEIKHNDISFNRTAVGISAILTCVGKWWFHGISCQRSGKIFNLGRVRQFR